jgi:hypothetical protein
MKKKKFLLEDVTFTDNSKSVDAQIDQLIFDAERLAVQAGMSAQQNQVEETIKNRNMKFIFEQEESKAPPLDVGTFANEIIGSVKLYEKVVNIPGIIDVPGVIIARAESFLNLKYGKDVVKQFKDAVQDDPVASKFLKSPNIDTPSGPIEQPLAVGATSGGGAA